ncbi:MAG: tetratricopeptide repeat protein [Thiobacillus sp.]
MHARLKTLLPVSLIVAVVALYWPSLHFPVFFDDINFFDRSGLNAIFLKGFAFEIRWLPYFTMAWVDLVFTDSIFAQRFINVGLHLVTAFVLYALVKQVSNHAAPHRNNERAALAAALLFLLHPLAVYAVGYLIQRTILMATLFGLLALNTYFDGLVTRKKAYFLFSALFYLLSTFSKEHAVLIPAAALALTPLAVPITRRTWRQLVLPFALFLPIALLVVIKSQNNLGRIYEPFAEQLVSLHGGESPLVIWMLSVMTQASLFFKYLLLALVPYPGWMSIDMRVPFAAHLGEPRYVLGLLALAAYGVTALLLLLKGGRRGLVGFALLAPLLLFAVEFSTVRIQEPFVLYRAYLWIPLLFLMIPALSYALSDKLFWPLVLAIALAFAASSHGRLQSFSSEFALWDDAVRKLPDELASGSARTFSNRGYLNMKRGDLDASIADFTRALRVDPAYKKAYQNRAFVYMRQGKYQAALQDANTVVRLFPEDPNNYSIRGLIHKSAGQFDKAMADYEIACKHKSISACVAIKVMNGELTPSGSTHQ